MVSTYFSILVAIAYIQTRIAVSADCTDEFRNFHDCMTAQNAATGSVCNDYSYDKFWTGINKCFTDNKCTVSLVSYENSSPALIKLTNDTQTKQNQSKLCIKNAFDNAKPAILTSLQKKLIVGNITLVEDPLPDLTQTMHACNPSAQNYYLKLADSSKCTNAATVKSCVQNVAAIHSPANITKLRQRINDFFCLYRKTNCSSKLSTDCNDKRKNFVNLFPSVAPLINDVSCKQYVPSNALKIVFNREKNCNLIAPIVNTYDQSNHFLENFEMLRDKLTDESVCSSDSTSKSSVASIAAVTSSVQTTQKATAANQATTIRPATSALANQAVTGSATSGQTVKSGVSATAGGTVVTNPAAAGSSIAGSNQVTTAAIGAGKLSTSVVQASTGSAGSYTTSKPNTQNSGSVTPTVNGISNLQSTGAVTPVANVYTTGNINAGNITTAPMTVKNNALMSTTSGLGSGSTPVHSVTTVSSVFGSNNTVAPTNGGALTGGSTAVQNPGSVTQSLTGYTTGQPYVQNTGSVSSVVTGNSSTQITGTVTPIMSAYTTGKSSTSNVTTTVKSNPMMSTTGAPGSGSTVTGASSGFGSNSTIVVTNSGALTGGSTISQNGSTSGTQAPQITTNVVSGNSTSQYVVTTPRTG